MIAVIFEVRPTEEGKGEYLAIAARLRELLGNQPGFISLGRFQSLGDQDGVLSVSFWENEESVQLWRNAPEHRAAQLRGKEELFHGYRIRVAHVARDYTDLDRDEAPSAAPQ